MTRVGSLFTGSGALDLAIHHALDASPAWFAENNPAASKVLIHNWPDIPNYGDVTKIDWATITPVEVLALGFPCQDMSTAGKRAGMRPGTRSGLWAHGAYAISQLRPELVVIENVRGLLSADAHCDMEPCPWCMGDNEGRPLRACGAVLGDLATLGYVGRWHGLRAADIGAPHGRFRIFITAWPAGHPYCFDRERWSTAGLKGETGPEARPATHPDSIRHERVGEPRGRWSGSPDHRQPPTDTTSNGRGEGRAQPAWIVRGPDAALSGDATPPHPASAGRGHQDDVSYDSESATQPARKTEPRRCDSIAPHPNEPGREAGSGVHQRAGSASIGDNSPAHNPRSWVGVDGTDYGPAIHQWETILGRPAPEPTQTGARGGQKLSGKFTEWMMGWSEGWVTNVPGVSTNDQIKLAGNGVVPAQADAALTHLLPNRQENVA